MADVLSRGAASLAGALLIVATTVSLMRTVVIPRSLRSAIADTVAGAVIWVTGSLARLRRTYQGRDTVLAWAGPSIIILQLLTWLFLYMIAYGLLIFGVSGMDVGNAIRQSGSSLLTLGFAAVNTENQTIIDFFAAATGPIVIAMLIGFLPTIYSAYLERETDIAMLAAEAGEPTWGPELLARRAMSDTLDTLPDTFAGWARWSARLRMTHVTYPVLVWVRSARADRHYVVALIAVMDAAALRLALTSSPRRSEAFALLLQGGQALEVLYVFLFARRGWSDRLPFADRFAGRRGDLARSSPLPGWERSMLAIQQASDIDAIRTLDRRSSAALAEGEQHPLSLTRAEFDAAVDHLIRSGYPVDRDRDEAWEQFRVTRVRYEFAAYELCRRLDAAPAPWSGGRRQSTPVMWPTLAIDILGDDHATETGDGTSDS